MPVYADESISGPRRMDEDFTREEWRFKAKNISSEFAPKIIALIEGSDFSKSCKINLVDIVNVSFDPNAILARNENLTQRRLELEVQLNLCVAAMDESDTANPTLLNITEAIVAAFTDFISPSLMGKVRDQASKQEMVHTQHYTGLDQPQQPPQQRGLQVPSWRKQG